MMTRTVLEGAKVTLLRSPSVESWKDALDCCRVTAGKEEAEHAPSSAFRRKLLAARHSPCRLLWFLFELDGIPTWVSTHLARHTQGIEKFILSQREDRTGVDRDSKPQSAPVKMVVSINAEALQTLANKRLCRKAHPRTRAVVSAMCELAEEAVPEFEGLLVPACVRQGGLCYEFECCGRGKPWDEHRKGYKDYRD